MSIEKIEAALTVAENYVIRSTFDSVGVESAIATLETARDIAMNNAPIWFADGNIAQWKLCMDNAQQFSAAIGLLKADGAVFDSAINPIERVKLLGEAQAIIKSQGAASPIERIKSTKRLGEISRLVFGGGDALQVESPLLGDKHTDENYRYADVGYIAGSRKELASETFAAAKKTGAGIRPTDVDWDALAQDSRLTESLITKSNIMGKIDWQSLKDGGMDGNAGFLISKLYASIDASGTDSKKIKTRVDKAAFDSKQNPKNYVTAIANLRDNMEGCKTLADVSEKVKEMSAGFWALHRRTALPDDDYETLVNLSMGSRFMYVAINIDNKSGDYRSALKMSGDNWDWARLKAVGGDDLLAGDVEKKERKKSFSLEASKTIERVGGAPVPVESTEQLKALFGLKAIQSGKWVLSDVDSAKFHVEHAAGAFMDMSDVTGIPVESLGLGGRLGVAFGARGKGGALAHYEPVGRVINITKMKGGGSLGHEYFHAIDNMMVDLMGHGNDGKADFFASDNASDLPKGVVLDAFVALNKTMLDGNERKMKLFKISDASREFAGRIKRSTSSGLAVAIQGAANLDEAIEIIDANHNPRGFTSRPRHKGWDDWIRGAGALFLGDDATSFSAADLGTCSTFYSQALILDGGIKNKYWSKPYEMAARAFSAYLEDKLKKDGRKNTYLSSPSDSQEAYPQGEERERINAAFDAVFKGLKDARVFELAMSNSALMDSLFGVINLSIEDIE